MGEYLQLNIPNPNATRGCRAKLTHTNSNSSAITINAVASTQPSPHSQIPPPVVSFFNVHIQNFLIFHKYLSFFFYYNFYNLIFVLALYLFI